MLKLAGILCILAGCMGWGAGKIGEERRRVWHLREVIRIMKRIQSEMVYGKHTLPEICLILAEYSAVPYQTCFMEIYEQTKQRDGSCLTKSWQRQMGQCMRDIPLVGEEKEILVNLPCNLGMSEETQQADGIAQSMDLLERRCRQAEDEYAGKSKMIFSVSLLTGIFLTILVL